MNEELSEYFKRLCYADMAINKAYTGNPLNNEWRNNLSEEDKKFLTEHARKMAEAD